jgi:hypothetical protein
MRYSLVFRETETPMKTHVTEAQKRMIDQLKKYGDAAYAAGGRPEVKALVKAGLAEWVTKKERRTVTFQVLRLTEKGRTL